MFLTVFTAYTFLRYSSDFSITLCLYIPNMPLYLNIKILLKYLSTKWCGFLEYICSLSLVKICTPQFLVVISLKLIVPGVYLSSKLPSFMNSFNFYLRTFICLLRSVFFYSWLTPPQLENNWWNLRVNPILNQEYVLWCPCTLNKSKIVEVPLLEIVFYK